MDPAWDEYRRRRNAFWLALLLFPLWFAAGVIIEHVLAGYGCKAPSGLAFLAVAMPPMACLVVTHLRRMLWPCPQCGRSFHVAWWYGNAFARRCVHCGLPKWTPKQQKAEADLQ
jgi:hypothetical protein